jgi:hypothetical protein
LHGLEGLDARETPTLPIADLSRRMAIRSPADLGAIIAVIRASTTVGHITEVHRQGSAGTGNSVADLPADGPWPDVIDAVFRDRAGRRYRLFVETWHGAGGEWAPIDDDD